MSENGKRFLRLFAMLAVAVVLLGLLFGAVHADPLLAAHETRAASPSTNASLHPAAQGVTGSSQTQPGNAGSTATTSAVLGVPSSVWVVALVVLVIIAVIFAFGKRGGGTSAINR